MPEGPEVKVLVDQLNFFLSKSTVNTLTINSGRYSKKAPDNYNDFIKLLPAKINSVNCKGKFIWFEFDNGWKIWNTLGMTGGWKDVKTKYSHLTLNFTKNSVNNEIYFDDYRNFGTFKFLNDKNNKLLNKKLNELGVDVLGKEFTFEYCKKVLKDKKTKQNSTRNINESKTIFWNRKLFKI